MTLATVVLPKHENAPIPDLDIHHVGGRIGAEISNVTLSSTLQPSIIAAIRQALLRHKVIFFRNQTHLTDVEQESFGRLLGDLVPHPTVPSLEGTQAILELDGARGERASSWHTDVTFRAAYPKISILRGHVVPERGGDTTWSNTETAYEELPEVFRDFIDKLWAVHSNEYDYVGDRGGNIPESAIKRYKQIFTSTVYEAEHPLVHVHSETGKRSLIIGHFVKRITGFGTADSQRIISILHDHATRPENTVRWRWSVGDVAIWDNRATLHRAVDDYDDQPRIVRRTTIAGEVPVSVDGQRSRERVQGSPSIAA
ncbi:TauD/TfdA dioxygenase family protein [Beijerinckia indica]|uniref:Taurine dioxygenase n=1 Tax=Beijerinckia indica subsp. indica (strain ATCC 9039 / DSM 1715 / NCIMB 8712) TaxID=395963 RepID=B2IF15_BEII9|nr:TauD/TfdA family dioxygenase [Beijerinckia indica]ACB94206.1 Taurine dioxygenase [Beijerinckia indica subsp. indica ATCC 9039]